MQDNPHQIVPLANTAGEILQPVRLRCKIVDRTALFGKMKTIKCLGFEGSKALCGWFFSNEVLKTKHGMKMPKLGRGQVVTIGKIAFTDDEMLIMVNSIERALLAIRFFSHFLPKKAMLFETVDLCNKLVDADPKNASLFTPIETFFENKTFIKDSDIKKFVDNFDKKSDNKDNILEDLMKIMRSKPTPEYENLPLNFDEDGLMSIENTFNLRQELALRHLQGETSLTMFQMMSEGLEKFGFNL